MKAGSIFLSVLFVLLIFNWVYVATTPDMTTNIILGTMTGLIVSVLAVSTIAGIQIAGSGLNSESIRTLFGVSTLLNMLFQITIAGLPVGLGLINNVLNVFPITELWGIGYFLASALAIGALVSGLMVVMGSGD